ncbi:hypoxanthine phosphoribosyltransferase, partial [Streptococcus suis]
MLDKDIKKILVSEEEIVAKFKELGQILATDYADKNPILVGILKCSIPFMAELMKHIDAHVETDY